MKYEDITQMCWSPVSLSASEEVAPDACLETELLSALCVIYVCTVYSYNILYPICTHKNLQNRPTSSVFLSLRNLTYRYIKTLV
jgi:hypothetical protein